MRKASHHCPVGDPVSKCLPCSEGKILLSCLRFPYANPCTKNREDCSGIVINCSGIVTNHFLLIKQLIKFGTFVGL